MNESKLGRYSWLVMEGPSTLKFPITTPASGKFFRGENITQSSTGAQGEIIGYQYDPISATGYFVVLPRVIGTGSGKFGWNSSDTITGNATGVTVNPSAVPIEFIREVMFLKSQLDNTNETPCGSLYYQCVDTVGEALYRFSYLATLATCTGGGGGDPNGWAPGTRVAGNSNAMPPLGSCVIKGFSGSATQSSNQQQYWITGELSYTAAFGRFHIIAVNADYTNKISPDGSFTVMVGFTAANGGDYVALTYQRVDNHEDGDVDPYAWLVIGSSSGSYTASTRLQSSVADINSSVDVAGQMSINKYGVSSWTWGKGFRRRGFATTNVAGSNNDNFQTFRVGSLGYYAGIQQGQLPADSYQNLWLGDGSTNSTAISQLPVRFRDPVWVFSEQHPSVLGPSNTAAGKMRKGTFRWLFSVANGNGGDLYNGKTWIQLSSIAGSFVVGPWDGVTTPLQL